ncbi:MAG: hypothetical protein CO149_04800 [Nitrospirae bacterium CG_4_9_14_3_um_filter_51_5]|nr:MAG: hypothetical protein CO149_04800 [Nitrospirae bacterium CG_4_9_14_3_um_filter_51_5]
MIIDAPVQPCTALEGSDHVYLSKSSSTWTREVSAYGLLPWQMQTIHKIIKLSNLQENWDSYDGKPPASNTISMAIKLIESLPWPYYDDVPVPAVIPTSEGGLQLEWSSEDRELDLEVRPSGHIELFKCQNGEPIDEGPLKGTTHLNSLVSWVLAV